MPWETSSKHHWTTTKFYSKLNTIMIKSFTNSSPYFCTSISFKKSESGLVWPYYILPFFIQLFLFLTPVIYPLSLVSGRYSWVFYLNPLTGVLDIFRSLLFNIPLYRPGYIFISLGSTVVLFILGILFFAKFCTAGICIRINTSTSRNMILMVIHPIIFRVLRIIGFKVLN